MGLKKSEAFKREAVQLVLRRGLAHKQVAADIGIGISTLNRWVTQHKDDDLMLGPHGDLHRKFARLCKENHILRKKRTILMWRQTC